MTVVFNRNNLWNSVIALNLFEKGRDLSGNFEKNEVWVYFQVVFDVKEERGVLSLDGVVPGDMGRVLLVQHEKEIYGKFVWEVEGEEKKWTDTFWQYVKWLRSRELENSYIGVLGPFNPIIDLLVQESYSPSSLTSSSPISTPLLSSFKTLASPDPSPSVLSFQPKLKEAASLRILYSTPPLSSSSNIPPLPNSPVEEKLKFKLKIVIKSLMVISALCILSLVGIFKYGAILMLIFRSEVVVGVMGVFLMVGEDFARVVLARSREAVSFRINLYASSFVLLNAAWVYAYEGKNLMIYAYILYNVWQGLHSFRQIYLIMENISQNFQMAQILNAVRGGDLSETLYFVLDQRSRNNR